MSPLDRAFRAHVRATLALTASTTVVVLLGAATLVERLREGSWQASLSLALVVALGAFLVTVWCHYFTSEAVHDVTDAISRAHRAAIRAQLAGDYVTSEAQWHTVAQLSGKQITP